MLASCFTMFKVATLDAMLLMFTMLPYVTPADIMLP